MKRKVFESLKKVKSMVGVLRKMLTYSAKNIWINCDNRSECSHCFGPQSDCRLIQHLENLQNENLVDW